MHSAFDHRRSSKTPPTGSQQSRTPPSLRTSASGVSFHQQQQRYGVRQAAHRGASTLSMAASEGPASPVTPTSATGRRCLDASVTLRDEVVRVLDGLQRVAAATHKLLDVRRVASTRQSLAASNLAGDMASANTSGESRGVHTTGGSTANLPFALVPRLMQCIVQEAKDSLGEQWDRLETMAEDWHVDETMCAARGGRSDSGSEQGADDEPLDAVSFIDITLGALFGVLRDVTGDVAAKATGTAPIPVGIADAAPSSALPQRVSSLRRSTSSPRRHRDDDIAVRDRGLSFRRDHHLQQPANSEPFPAQRGNRVVMPLNPIATEAGDRPFDDDGDRAAEAVPTTADPTPTDRAHSVPRIQRRHVDPDDRRRSADREVEPAPRPRSGSRSGSPILPPTAATRAAPDGRDRDDLPAGRLTRAGQRQPQNGGDRDADGASAPQRTESSARLARLHARLAASVDRDAAPAEPAPIKLHQEPSDSPQSTPNPTPGRSAPLSPALVGDGPSAGGRPTRSPPLGRPQPLSADAHQPETNPYRVGPAAATPPSTHVRTSPSRRFQRLISSYNGGRVDGDDKPPATHAAGTGRADDTDASVVEVIG